MTCAAASSPRATAAVGVLTLFALAACGAGGGAAGTNSGTATSTPTVSTPAPSSPPASAPAVTPLPGGPAPPELLGKWTQVADKSFVIVLTGDSYDISNDSGGGGSGNIVVNGSEIDFFQGNVCQLDLPKGVGRYQWTLRGTTLSFAPLNRDPCGRWKYLTNQSFTKG